MNKIENIQTVVNSIISDKLHFDIPAPNKDLFAMNVFDSLSLVDFIMNLEQQFGMKISFEDLDLDIFRTIDSICNFVATSIM